MEYNMRQDGTTFYFVHVILCFIFSHVLPDLFSLQKGGKLKPNTFVGLIYIMDNLPHFVLT